MIKSSYISIFKTLGLIILAFILNKNAAYSQVLVQYDATNYNVAFNSLNPSCTSTLTSSYSTLGVSGLSTAPYGYCPGRFAACGYFQITAKSQPGYAYCNSAVPSLSTTPDYISFTVTPSASNCVYINQFNIYCGAYGNSTTHGADQVLVGYSTDGGLTWVTGPIFTLIPGTTGATAAQTGTGNCAPTPSVATGCATIKACTWNMTPFSSLTPVIFKIIPFDATKCDCSNGHNGNDEWAMTQIEVDGIAAPPPTITVTPTSVCLGSSTNLTANSGGTAVSYTWNTGSTSNPLSVSPTTNTTYTVTGTSASGCTNTATGVVTVNSLPTVTANNQTICTGSTTTLTAGGASTYTWSTSATTNSITVNPTTNTNYTVTGTDVNSCTNTATSIVTVNALPTITIANDSVCNGSTGTLVANGANTYTWNTGSSGSTFTVANVTSNANYTVTGTDAATTCTNTAIGNIIVNSFSINVNNPTICSGTSATLTASGANTYTWSTSANTTSIVVTPTVTTSYTVTGTGAAGCTGTAVAVVTVSGSGSNITVAPTKSVTCYGMADTLNATGASTYTWVASDGTIISTNGPQAIVTQTASVTYTVSGSLGGSCVATPTVITINVNPPVSLTIIPTPTNVVCSGNSITLTASGANTYTWTPGITNGVSFTPASSQTYSVTGTDANGCKDSSSIPVTVTNLTITATALHPLLCAGATDTLSAAGASSYTWTPGVTSISGSAYSQVTTTTAATYTVMGALGTCSATTTVIVNNAPPIALSISANPGAIVCTGNNVVLTASGALTYTWSGGVNNGIPFIPPSTPASQSYAVTGTDANNCTASAVQNITINPTPTISINATSPSVCLGQDSTTLIASGSTIVSYSWSTGATASSITVSPNSTQTYTVTGMDGNGCLTGGGATTTIAVNTPVPITITSSMGNSVCSGATTILTATSTQPSYTYTWNNGTVSAINTVSPVTPTSYSVNGVDGNGCKDSATISINISPAPALPTVTGNTFICWNMPTVLTATDAVNGVNYIWMGPAPSTNTVSTSSTASVNLPGTYVVVATNTCGVSAPATQTLVGDTVKASITSPTVSPSTGFAPDTVHFSGQATTIMGTIVGYHWDFGNGDSAHIQNPSEIYTAPSLSVNTYTATLVAFDNNGCWDTAHIVVIVKEIPTNIIIPNIFSPNGDGINDIFFVITTGISNFDCKIYDRWGLLLHEWTGIDGGWDGKGKNGNNSPDGTYFYIINYNDNQSKPVKKNGFFEMIR